MTKPTILTVDDDPAVSQAIARDLRRRYGPDYHVVRVTSGAEALTALADHALRDREVALIAADQRMPAMTGVEFLEQARSLVPEAKLVLLTAYADTDAAIRAINEIDLDHYLLKPWNPPEERLYPVLDELLADWRDAHPDHSGDIRVVGHRWSETSHQVKTFLARNHVPYRWLDVERDVEAQRLVEAAHASQPDLPLVLIPESDPLRAPSHLELATALNLGTTAQQPLYDLCVVGAGPAGMAAAVYAASEGLQTVVIEREAPGGQAGQSASIENYLGFPRGLSGTQLTHRAVAQIRRFGAEMVLARDVVRLEQRGPVHGICFGDGSSIEARAVLVATGVSYRMLAAPTLIQFAGRGMYYGATESDARNLEDEDVYVVGAANSAGQAVLNFARRARSVTMIVRSSSLEKSMSSYLIERIRTADNVEVRLQSEVVAGRGAGHLQAITLADRATGTEEELATEWLFVFIGAAPHTDWLGDAVVRDEKGFVVTGPELLVNGRRSDWPLDRAPFGLETSTPGVFAAGDVRLDSMKRVASAVGEGAMSVHLVHRYLETV